MINQWHQSTKGGHININA